MKFLPVLIVVVLLTACSSVEPIRHVSPAEADDMIAHKADLGLFVLNVHTPVEGELAGTDEIIEDWEHIADHMDQLPEDKNAPMLVYCRSGRMSASAVEQLKELGYGNIYHLDGGMIAWEDAGFYIENKTFE